ncbi:MAG: translation initiation factor IF-3 [Patescibacteria group bacterium]|nr:translation initiation factor IF-3 [Patescibacteria group bacterium]
MRRVYHRPRPDFQEKRFKVNQQIRVPEVFLIDESGQGLGVMPTSKALALALEAGLDVVEVNPKAQPPVVKIIDYGQFKYRKEKEAQKQKVKQKKIEIKGIRLSVRISQHDFDFRIEQARKFLARGDKLKLELVLKGRERQHPEIAEEMMKKFYHLLKETPSFNVELEQGLTKQGGRFNIVVINKQ